MTNRLPRAALAVGLALLGASATRASAECAMPTPRTPDTSRYGVLQLPIARDGGGKPERISGARLQGYSGPYFERQGGERIVMSVPTDGLAATPHSKYPRSGLKESRTWSFGEGCAVEAARLRVLALPASGDIVIG